MGCILLGVVKVKMCSTSISRIRNFFKKQAWLKFFPWLLSRCFKWHFLGIVCWLQIWKKNGFAGIESFSKLGDSIYFGEDADVPALYIIQYISSTFNWTSGQMILKQDVKPVVSSSDAQLRASLTFSTKEVLYMFHHLRCRLSFMAIIDKASPCLFAFSLLQPLHLIHLFFSYISISYYHLKQTHQLLESGKGSSYARWWFS